MTKSVWTVRTLLLIIFIDYLGVGIVFVIAPEIFLSSHGIWNYYENPLILKFFFCLFLGMYPLGQFFGANFLGKLSDKYGRRKVLLITIPFTLIGYLTLNIGLVVQSITLLIMSRLLTGLFAGNVAIAQASIIDLSDTSTKAKYMSVIQSVIGLAWIIGTPIGGLLFGYFSYHVFKFSAPILFIAFFLLIAYAIIYFSFIETLKISATNLKESNHAKLPLDSIVKLLLVIWFLFIFAQWVFEALMPGYFVEKFSYSALHIGTILGLMGLMYTIIQLLVVKKLANKVNHQNFIIGSFFGVIIALLIFVTSYNSIQLFLSLFIYVLSMAFILSYYSTLISDKVGETRQGEIMGKLSSLQAIAAILAMFIGGGINILNYDYPVIISLLSFFLSAIVFVIGIKITNQKLKAIKT